MAEIDFIDKKKAHKVTCRDKEATEATSGGEMPYKTDVLTEVSKQLELCDMCPGHEERQMPEAIKDFDEMLCSRFKLVICRA